MTNPDRRKDALTRLIDDLFDPVDDLVDAVTADGWPAPMVREGFNLHRRTWDVDRVADQLDRELDALDHPDTRLAAPDRIVHIWPRLPGAGLTPVLYGALLGADQAIRPSSEAGHFAEFVADLWRADGALPDLELLDPDDDWTIGDVLVVSGTDETLAEIRRKLDERRGPRAVQLTGYGHRVSVGVVPEHPDADLDAIADGFARDAVLWHQSGCFSLRGVLVCGADDRCENFARELADAIETWETSLDARPDDPAVVARRTQAHDAAEFEGRAIGDGFGWVEPTAGPFRGESPAPHAVTCHPIDGVTDLDACLDLPAQHLQGVALPEADDRGAWIEALVELGATRICRPGDLQAPPADWLHDGRPNVLEWLRGATVDRASGTPDG